MKLSLLSKILPAAAAVVVILSCPLSSIGAVANVSVVNDSFSPGTTSINVGDTVVWTWASGAANHNVVSTSATRAWLFPNTGGTASNQNNSNLKNAPFVFTNVFTSAGSFPYECTEHAGFGMVGTINVAAVANQPPTVTVTNPASGTVFITPASVTIQASAADSDGSVTNVQFRIGTTILTNEIAAPFSAVINNLPAGSYTLAAIASDNLGATATNSVSMIVDTPPVVTITNPPDNATLSAPANVTVQAIASDSDAGGTVTNVQFFVGAIVLTNEIAAPFSAATNILAAGGYTFSAVASDQFGVKNTNAVSINIVNPVPATFDGMQLSSSTNFQFSYAANVGLGYVVQLSTDLASTNWISIVTNVAASNPVIFTDNHATNNPGFYRVGRLPNP
ncbi:MAG TPA: Ig-like domain-containing protein [Verrucomicrobiae bacterium]